MSIHSLEAVTSSTPPIKNFQIAMLPGDGIGVEVMREAVKVLRAVEAHGKTLGRSLVGEGGKPIGPLRHADVALNQRHAEQLLGPFEPMFLDEGRACQRHDALHEERLDDPRTSS